MAKDMNLYGCAFPAASLMLVSRSADMDDGSPLKIGDGIILNSGGPDMTVVDIDGGSNATIVAAWRDGEGNAHEAAFPRACVCGIK